MDTNTKVVTLAISFSLMLLHQTSGAELKGNELIEKLCKQSPHKELCIEVLSSDPTSSFGNIQDLALISLRVAAANATGILSEAKMMIDNDSLDPSVQQGLADCKEKLLDAESQLEDSFAAVLSNIKHDSKVWVQTAVSAIEACDASIPGNNDVLSVKSVQFHKLCDIAASIIKASLAQLP